MLQLVRHVLDVLGIGTGGVDVGRGLDRVVHRSAAGPEPTMPTPRTIKTAIAKITAAFGTEAFGTDFRYQGVTLFAGDKFICLTSKTWAALVQTANVVGVDEFEINGVKLASKWKLASN